MSKTTAETASTTLEIQREHNRKSVTPILLVQTLSHDEEVSVKLTNNGIGPLIITSLTATNGSDTNYNLIDWMPLHPKGITYWSTYSGGAKGTSISPGTSIPLLLLANDDENYPDYVLYRAFVRRNLSKLSITVKGTDIYDFPILAQKISLNWFANFISKWFKENFPEDFHDDVGWALRPRRTICSVEEWDKKVAKVKSGYRPNRLFEKDEVNNATILTVD